MSEEVGGPTRAGEPRGPAARVRLADRVPLGAALDDPGAILDRFLSWVADAGLTPYAAQEEALLELMDGKHVVLATPTGSGKSLVALGLHFKALCEGRRSFYTAPIKALVSEKFFSLCDTLGAENVGMLTGDASINWGAPVICCTAEVLANMSLRQGRATDAPYVVMDEFHYYSDRDRGVAWQVPLLTLPDTTFLLMSATLGNTAAIEERLAESTGRAVAHVWSDERPVPLDFAYKETPLHETVEKLLDHQQAPIYVVNFTQRECAEVGAALSSARIAGREERRRIAEAVGGFRFDSPYGKEMKRLISHGVGLHHAGLLPKYRLLVEQLSQQGLLKVISGTDTLGVGVNIPIRTVLFTKLAKFDGEKVRILSVRDFKQIAGRAGRKGFDEQGSVVCQAPEHVVYNRKATQKDKKRAGKGGRGKPTRKRAPQKGDVTWSEKTFRTLIKSQPEMLISRFRVSHGMLLNVLQRDRRQTGPRGGYGAFVGLIDACHETPATRRRLRRDAAALVRSLRRAEILRVADHRLVVEEDLQRNFSLHHTLSLWLVDAVASLDPEEPGYALDVLSLVEAMLENPRAILFAQVRKLRDALFAQMKAEGVPYEERMEKAERVTWPRPLAEFVRETFELFVQHHPWAAEDAVRPKSVAREMVERYASFDAYVREYGLMRVEGLLLRYLGQVYQALVQTVPDADKTEDLHDVIAYLRSEVAHVDSSLLSEWESMVRPGAPPERGAEPEARPRLDLALTPKAFRARVRAEMRSLVRALAAGDLEEAARWLAPPEAGGWTPEQLANALEPFLRTHERVVFDPHRFHADRTVITQQGPRRFRVQQVLPDPAGEDVGWLEGEVDLGLPREPDTPLVRPVAIREE